MKRLVLAGASILGLFTACGGDDDGNADVLCPINDEGVQTSCIKVDFICPGSADGMAFTFDNGAGDVFTQEYDCLDTAIILQTVPAGTWDVFATPTRNSDPFISSPISTVTVLAEDPEPQIVFVDGFPEDKAYFAASWSINEGGTPITCADISSSGVSLLTTLVSGDEAPDYIVNCEDGLSGPIVMNGPDPALLGEYVIQLSLLVEQDGADAALASTPAIETSLTYGSELNTLAPVEFDLNDPFPM